jgi:hypothetical protein
VLFVAATGGLLDFHSEPSMDKDRIKTTNAICPLTATNWEKVLGVPAPWTLKNTKHRFVYTPWLFVAGGKTIEGAYWDEDTYGVWVAVQRTRPCFQLKVLAVKNITPEGRLLFPTVAHLYDTPIVKAREQTYDELAAYQESITRGGTTASWGS